jgi:hypothetical protein
MEVTLEGIVTDVKRLQKENAYLSIAIDYNCAVFLISKELLKRCPTRVATLVGQA